MEACANDHNISSNATWARDRSNCREVSPDQAYGLGRLVQRAYVADYATQKLSNDPAQARQYVPGPNTWRGGQLIAQGHHFIQCIFHPCISFFLYDRGAWVSTRIRKIPNPQ